jgi:DNA-binding response OmpR family regulator
MPSIFILDDIDDILFTLDFWLTQHGHQVYTFNKSKDLINAINIVVPDFILLDVRLAELKDGRVLCIELRQHHHYTNPIYLFSSTSVMNSDLLTCGADGFIKKPFDLQKVLITINNALVDV